MPVRDDAYTRAIIPLVQERMKLLTDFLTIGDYFFTDTVAPDAAGLPRR